MTARPYARIRGSEPSVTTIISANRSVPALPWAAARLTAEYVLEEFATLLALADPVKDARRYHADVWASQAAIGTLAHLGLEAMATAGAPLAPDEAFDIDAHVYGRAEGFDRPALWVGNEEWAAEHVRNAVASLADWWADHAIVVIASEFIVRTPGRFVGTADLWASIDLTQAVVDLKTTTETDQKKGIYLDKWGAQLAAYASAEELVAYGDDGARVLGPNLLPNRGLILHVRTDGSPVAEHWIDDLTPYRKWFDAMCDAHHAHKELP